ncbi:hypothetical protein C5F59_012750 [Streptomyces sp. QL37]|uniref:hypothetical protein n=1 Tax=Streptomyces sp. QL37 TaxID=2093747 RepID=UPI0011AFFCE5|nr:hypothetical protein [Streptomyces sp. QL37]
MSPVPGVVVWIAVISTSTQALMTAFHARRSATESGPGNALSKRSATIGLIVSAFVTLWLTLESYARETRRLGSFSYSVIRDELDTTFFRVVLFIFDIATYVILFLPVAELLGVVITILACGRLGRAQALVHLTTLATATTASVLIVVTKTRIDGHFDIPWPWCVMYALSGAMVALEVLATQPRDGSALDADATESAVPQSGEQAHQSPGRGRVLTVLGWAMLAPALPLGLVGFILYGDLVPEAGLSPWLEPLIAVGVVVPPFLLFIVGDAVLKRGRQHRHRIIPSLDELAGERYLLYLRPFAIDPVMALPPDEVPGWYTRSPFELTGTHEEFLVRQFRGLGRVVAVGQPGEPLPALGAERGYLPVDKWKDTVSGLIQGAHAVIMTAAPGPGTAWEFTEVLRTTTPDRLLLLIYEDEMYQAFQEAAADEYATRSSAGTGVDWPPLPRFPDLPPPAPHTKGIRWDFPLKGILSFDGRWCPRFTRFPPTVPRIRHVWVIRRLVRRELRPAMDPISQLPPAPRPPDRA